METNQKTTPVKQTRLLGIVLAIPLLLLVPLVAMQFNNGVNWTGTDFAVAGTLLLSAGLGCEFILRKVKGTPYRLLFCGVLFIVFFLIWAELAVGIFGTPIAGS